MACSRENFTFYLYLVVNYILSVFIYICWLTMGWVIFQMCLVSHWHSLRLFRKSISFTLLLLVLLLQFLLLLLPTLLNYSSSLSLAMTSLMTHTHSVVSKALVLYLFTQVFHDSAS
jgi:hypothetical protein